MTFFSWVAVLWISWLADTRAARKPMSLPPNWRIFDST